jgi:hypothetical protein
MSIQSQVSDLLTITPGLTKKGLKELLPDINPKTIDSCYNRHIKSAKNNAEYAADALNKRITMDLVEQLIIQGNTPVPILRVMTDFLKVKSQDQSELQEIDLDIFYKKAMED